MNNLYFPIFSLFLVLIVIEVWVSGRNQLKLYRKTDTIANISIAVLSFIIIISYKGVAFYFYSLFYSFSLFTLNHGILYWVFLFLSGDLTAYGFHYLSHKSRFFWASHVIHHSSEKYNLTTAIRVPITNFFYRFIFYIPLCFFGFSPLDVLLVESVINLYNFYLHTEFIRNMGWFEWILNTPSHHRVHHGMDEKYIDKNFGSILIIWDRLFRTFVKEEEKPTYGITNQLKSQNILNIIGNEWLKMYDDFKQARNWKERWNVLFNKPNWQPTKKFENKWALITGASSGIGLAIAENLASEGANLVLVALPNSNQEQIASSLKSKYGIQSVAIEIDLSLKNSANKILNQCLELGVELDILINNAGVGNYKFFDETSQSEILNMLQVNNQSMVLLTHKFIHQLKKKSKTYILNVASMASFEPVPCKSVYSASKSFVLSFSKSLKLELNDANLVVSCLLPGSTLTSNAAENNIKNTPFQSSLFVQSPIQVAQKAIIKMQSGCFRIIPGFHNRVIYFIWRVCPPILFQIMLNAISKKKRSLYKYPNSFKTRISKPVDFSVSVAS